ncbi:hypothetical protein Kpol_1073p17 [Vanderwaltozyma polyspora DSM 70294]|uniref:RNA recognition motif domain-containing protein n=1 Tax=Vanderwaltozyma polyspora (strain ATCC 22028 / DSM 70294 / BCRC 21397 / CBS 2163 / NBRC 10782 / NRRL Y-8283 / UCD 57-17) TaxID=436907 RepID=A7TPT0_VANPO|nr:uncharacterized protein Kpol_1073p17 [Vanderwaltozyma polyspora DSM 70294]EDO15731.1 hypothetical protein Kpol_1073p17 [Vanderwaltozyma polyspora DSM 70294]
MSIEQSLEDVRSKIIASMASKNSGDSNSSSGQEDNKRTKYERLPSGPRQGNQSRFENKDVGYSNYHNRQQHQHQHQHQHQPSGSRYRGNTYNDRTSNRYNNGYRMNNRYQGGNNNNNNGNNRPYQKMAMRGNNNVVNPLDICDFSFRDEELANVTSIDKRQRMKPTRWDVTPEGFEKVLAERAKLSGLFPQPGQPQELDRTKLARVVFHGGTKSRRTRILFEDATENMLNESKASCQVVITGVKKEFELPSLENLVTVMLEGMEEEYELKSIKKATNKGEEDDHEGYVVIEVNCGEAATILISAQWYIKDKLGEAFDEAKWSRPGSYIGQTGEEDSISDHSAIAIKVDQEDEKNIQEKYGPLKFTKMITYKEKSADGESKMIDTGMMLIPGIEEEDKKLQGVKWIKPNESSSMKQERGGVTFQSISKLVVEKKRKESKTLLLLNCVDPLDLKNLQFLEEIKDTIEEGLEGVEKVKIRSPNADYRLNLEHVNEGIGNIYIRFDSVENCQEAIKRLSGSKFNDRTVLCSYYDDNDFDHFELL